MRSMIVARTAPRQWKGLVARTPKRDAPIFLLNRANPSWRDIQTIQNVFPTSRTITTYSTPVEKLKTAVLKARRENPILLPVLFVAAIGAMSLLGLMAYDEYTRVQPHYSAYPTAASNRPALHTRPTRPR